MNIYKKLTVLGVIGIITSCSGSDSDDTINIITVSGAKHKLDGAYGTGCFTADNIDGQKNFNFIFGKEWTSWVYIFPGDLDCTGNVMEQSELIAALSVRSVAAITGWVDENDVSVAPPAADDGSQLNNIEPTTLLHTVVTGVSGTEFPDSIGTEANILYIVDDTNGRIVLHRHWDTADINNLTAINSTQYPPLVKIY